MMINLTGRGIARLSLSLILSAFSLDIYAVSTHGRAQFGTYQVKSKLTSPVNGTQQNDKSIFSTRIKTNIDEISRNDDQVVVELRDKFDLYGKVDPELLQLDQENELQVRQAVFQRPFNENRFYFSLGRFNIAHAGVLVHDGGEAGYRFTKAARAGAFAGQLPSEFLDPLQIEDEVENEIDRTQGGAYFTYNGRLSDLIDNLYATNALLTQPNRADLGGDSKQNLFHHMAHLSLNGSHRLLTYLDYELSPDSTIRRSRFSYLYYSRSFRSKAYAYQVTAEDYPPNREVVAELVPSGMRIIGGDLQFNLNENFSLKGQMENAIRIADSLNHREILGGIVISGLSVPAMSIAFSAGQRDLYQTKGTVLKASINYYNRFFNLRLSQSFAKETRTDTGESVDPIFTSIDADVYVSESFRGSVAATLLKSRQQTTTSVLFIVGTGFGKRRVSPVRETPAEFESF